MIYLLIQLAIWLILALILGVAIGWWLWHRKLQLITQRYELLESQQGDVDRKLLSFEEDRDQYKAQALTLQSNADALSSDLKQKKQAHADQIKKLEASLKEAKNDAQQASARAQDSDKALAASQATVTTQLGVIAKGEKSQADLQAELDRINGLHIKATNDVKQLQKERSTLEAKLKEQKKSLAALDDLKAQLLASETKLGALQSAHEKQTHQMQEQRQSLEDATTKASGLAATLAALNQSFEQKEQDYTTQIEALKAALKASQKDTNQANSRAQESDKAHAAAQATVTTQLGVIAKGEKSQAELQAELDRVNGLHIEATSNVKQLQKERSTLEAKLTEQEKALASLEELKAKLLESETQLGALQATSTAQTTRLNEVLQSLDDAQSNVLDISTQSAALNAAFVLERQSLNEACEALRLELEKVREERNQAIESTNLAKQDAERSMTQYTQLQHRHDELILASDAHKASLHELQGTHQHLESIYRDESQALNVHRALLEESTLEQEALNMQLTSNNAQLEQLKAALALAEESLQKAQAQAQDSEKAQAAAQATVTTQLGVIAKGEKSQAELQAELDRVNGLHIEVTSDVKQLQKERSTLEAKLKEQEKALVTLSDLNAQLAALQARFDALNTEHKQQTESLDHTRELLVVSRETSSSALAEVTLLGNTVAGLREDHQQRESELVKRSESVAQLTTQVEANQAMIAQHIERADQWHATADDLRDQLHSAQQSIEEKDKQYKALFEQHAHTQSMLSNVESRSQSLMTHQGDILALGQTTHKTTIERFDDVLSKLAKTPSTNTTPLWFVSYLKQVKQQDSDRTELARLKAELERLELLYAQIKANDTRLAAELKDRTQQHVSAQISAQKAYDSLLKQNKSYASEHTALKDALLVAEAPCEVCKERDSQVQLVMPQPAALTPPPMAAADVVPDALQRIKGIGPVLESMLHSLGYKTFDQLAQWTGDNIDYVTKQLDCFPDRIVRDEWVSQAAAFAAE